MTVSEIAEKIKLSFKSVSKHLQILEAAGFLSRHQIINNAYYSLTKDNYLLRQKISHFIK